ADDEHALCVACRLNKVVPDMSVEGNREAWYKLETAKRRLVYTLLALKLPVVPKSEDPERGLAFSFMASVPNEPVMTGHDNGHIV
ncbi:putative zinc-binding metallopeptidase, partial [Klebsiella pneumoniae]|nr:putative zinc-binding metallopeptidase [Klebsiella pneumoniae]